MKAQFQKRGGTRAAPTAPPGSRVYAIGDVHGRLDLLRRLLELIRDDAAQGKSARKVVVYLGDYIDRGPESKGVIDLLLSRPMRNAGFEEIRLMGNHEDILLQFLADVRCGPHWFAYGGMATLESYGVRPPGLMAAEEDLVRAQRDLQGKIPPAHLEFLRRMPLRHEEGGYLFVHAGLRPGVALDEQIGQDLMWIRDEFLESDADFGKLVVHGHTIAEAPQLRANRIGIDTGAYATGVLTALVLEGNERRFIQTSARMQK
jgi:serine/threonine protein phosphatase 1